jgi:hypothetical protein
LSVNGQCNVKHIMMPQIKPISFEGILLVI